MSDFTPEDFRRILREELADAGLRLDDTNHQDEAREDFRYLRRIRKGSEKVAGYVGMAVIIGLTSAAIWLVTQGLNFWRTS